MDHPKRFDDLVTECTWTLMAGITEGSKLSALVRNIMSSTIEWKNGLDKESPKPGFVNQLERLNERVAFERDQLKEQVQNLTAALDKLEHRLGEVAAERDKLKDELASKDQAIEVLKQTQGSLIQEIAAQRDAEKQRGDIAVAQRGEWQETAERFKKERDNFKAMLDHFHRQNETHLNALSRMADVLKEVHFIPEK